MNELYHAGPRETRRRIEKTIRAGRVPFVKSSPGVGKSSLFRNVARAFNLKLIDHRLSTSDVTDLNGLPDFVSNDRGIRHATFSPFDIFPTVHTPIPDGYDGWLLFFDEFTSAEKEMQAACYKIMLDRMIGQTPLHDHVAIGCAGNLMTDRAVVNNLSTAMQSRLIHMTMEVSHKEWLLDVALPNNYDERIIAYLNYDEAELMNFRPDHKDETFNCPRTWEFMNDLLRADPVIIPEDTGLFAGTISSGSAASFVQFCEVYKELMSVEEILKDPTGAPVLGANESQRAWALTSHLMGKTNDKNFKDLATYVNRMGLSFRILYFRGLIARKPQLRSHPTFATAMTELHRYLKED